MEKRLLKSLEDYHMIIDTLQAHLISMDVGFMPSQQPYWDLLVEGHDTIKEAKGE